MELYRIVYAPMLTTMPVVERAVLVGELQVEGVLKGTIGGHCMFLVPAGDGVEGLSYDHAEIIAMVAGDDDEEGQGRPATGRELCSAVRAMWPEKVDMMRWMNGVVKVEVTAADMDAVSRFDMGHGWIMPHVATFPVSVGESFFLTDYARNLFPWWNADGAGVEEVDGE